MIFKLVSKIINKIFKLDLLFKQINEIKILNGLNILDSRKLVGMNINDYELKIFSQFGEDGIIDFLVKKLNIKSRHFIEFGVEDYEESNTRFLLEARSWSGEIYEANKNYVQVIKNKNIYWRYNLSVKNTFVTKKNINILVKNFLKESNIDQLGLLSIDIDGVDYWIWKELNIVHPEIVVVEYNARLGYEKSIVVPYESSFNRIKKHYSSIYFGASLNALFKLGIEKGYSLVGTNMNGSNAFFVKKNLLKKIGLPKLTPFDCYHKNSFNELRSKSGLLEERNKKIEDDILKKMNFIEV
jgi:hypothetical protein